MRADPTLERMWRLSWWCLILILAGGCSRSIDQCRRDAEATECALYRLLVEAHTREELRERLPKLRRLYLELAQLQLAAEKAYDRDEWVAAKATPSEWSEKLRLELIRVYELEGGRELVENAQDDAIRLLVRKSSSRAVALDTK